MTEHFSTMFQCKNVRSLTAAPKYKAQLELEFAFLGTGASRHNLHFGLTVLLEV